MYVPLYRGYKSYKMQATTQGLTGTLSRMVSELELSDVDGKPHDEPTMENKFLTSANTEKSRILKVYVNEKHMIKDVMKIVKAIQNGKHETI